MTTLDMLPCTPDRSLQQRRDAIARANAVRIARKELRQCLRGLPRPAAAAHTARLVREPVAGVTTTMKVYSLLMACPGMGEVATTKLLRRLHISPSKTIGGLTPRQRQQLGVALDEIARRRLQTRITGRHD